MKIAKDFLSAFLPARYHGQSDRSDHYRTLLLADPAALLGAAGSAFLPCGRQIPSVDYNGSTCGGSGHFAIVKWVLNFDVQRIDLSLKIKIRIIHKKINANRLG